MTSDVLWLLHICSGMCPLHSYTETHYIHVHTSYSTYIYIRLHLKEKQGTGYFFFVLASFLFLWLTKHSVQKHLIRNGSFQLTGYNVSLREVKARTQSRDWTRNHGEVQLATSPEGSCLTDFLIQPRTAWSGNGAVQSGLTLVHQSIVKTIPHMPSGQYDLGNTSIKIPITDAPKLFQIDS